MEHSPRPHLLRSLPLPEGVGPNAPGLTAEIEIHDSEIIAIEQVLNALNDRLGPGRRTVLAAFDKEVKDRFAEIGFIVQVAWWETNVEGVFLPEVCIADRTESHEFDYDRQVHEVTHDVLNLGEGGVIETSPEDYQPPEHGH